MLKKMLLLASMALAAVAFAVPASASATDVWTHDHVPLEEEEKVAANFEGFLAFTTPPPAVPVHSTFGCEVTVTIVAEGPSGGQVTAFNPTTETCVGTGVFTGCTLVTGHTTNPPWAIDIANTPGTVGSEGNPIVIHNTYNSTCPAGETTVTQFNGVNIDPTVDGNGTITHIHVSGTATNGFTIAEGSVTPEPEDEPTLGIEEL